MCVSLLKVHHQPGQRLQVVYHNAVLGPLLFAIFIEDMPDEVEYNLCKLFASDCKLYGTVNDDEVNKMQMDLKSLEI